MKDYDDLLAKYNKLRLEKKQLLAANRTTQVQIDTILNSKAWHIASELQANKLKLIDEPKRRLYRLVKGVPKINDGPFTYASCYEENEDFSGRKTDIKPLAFYLPQFHNFPENDKWWGEGFTEWTNTKVAGPRFAGHYEPREPHDDFGYYALDNVEIFRKQISLAKQHGVFGFAFYYYWFSGKQLMDKPMEIWLDNRKELDFPFCFCWANENWTRRWDGKNEDVLIRQKYAKSDPEKFILDMKKFLMDPRYIKVGGAPVIMVYNPAEIPDFEQVVKIWRKTAKREKIGEIVVWSRNNILNTPLDNYKFVDGEFDFAPNAFNCKDYKHSEFTDGNVYDYASMVIDLEESAIYDDHFSPKPFYYSVTMGWDNSPRRKQAGYTSFINYSPLMFYNWLRTIIAKTREVNAKGERFIFVNAWNEWGEGVYLEPDKCFGYANINTLSRAIYDLPFDPNTRLLNRKSPTNVCVGKVALQVHVFYEELVDELSDELEKMPFEYDLYISTNAEEKKEFIRKKLKERGLLTNRVKIEVFPNHGRDVFPFLKQLSDVYQKYDFVGHLHTKKTVEHGFGDEWRKYLYSQLIGSRENVGRVFGCFNDPTVGLVFPATFSKVAHSVQMGSNGRIVNSLLKKMKLPEFSSNEPLMFAAGTMFWARREAIEKIFALQLSEKDFADEAGQIDGTTAHALERLFGIVPVKMGYKLVQTFDEEI